MEFYNDEQISKICGIQEATLAAWRARGQGPPVTYIGRLPRYRKDLFDKWVEQRTTTPKRKPRKRARRNKVKKA